MTPEKVRPVLAFVAVFSATFVAGLGLMWHSATMPTLDSETRGIELQNAVAFDAAGSAEEFLPSGWKAWHESENRVRGWGQSGIVPLPPADAMPEVDASMARCGYAAKLRISGKDGDTQLVQYENARGEKVVWSLSPSHPGKTVFSCKKQ